MAIKMELHPDVDYYVKHRCNQEEQTKFFKQLGLIRTEPVRHSEATVDAKLSRYVLRFFRFGDNIAIFEFDAGHSRVRVLECHRLLSGKHPRAGP